MDSYPLQRAHELFVIPELAAFSETRRLGDIDPAELIMQTFSHHHAASQGVARIVQETIEEDGQLRSDIIDRSLFAAKIGFLTAMSWRQNMSTLQEALLGTRLQIKSTSETGAEIPGIIKESWPARPVPEATATVARHGSRNLWIPCPEHFVLYDGRRLRTRYLVTPLTAEGEPQVTLTTIG